MVNAWTMQKVVLGMNPNFTLTQHSTHLSMPPFLLPNIQLFNILSTILFCDEIASPHHSLKDDTRNI